MRPSRERPVRCLSMPIRMTKSLTTVEKIAYCASRGADVHVVTCTLGEDGEVIGEPYAQPLSTLQTSWAVAT